MEYIEYINTELRIDRIVVNPPLVYDLFAGCGGLALGFESVGFRTVGFETNEEACKTYDNNLNGECKQLFLEPGIDLGPKPDIIVGGPPCQPFSVRGLQNGTTDRRNGFPAFLSIVARYEPKIVIFENVRGILYRNKSYFNYILKSLSDLHYVVTRKVLNASHYGVPQNRERVFVIAHRGQWDFPPYIKAQKAHTSGEALGELAYSIPENVKFLTPNIDKYIAKYELKSKCIRPRDLHLDKPSRTLTCRNLSGATADMMRIRLPDGRRRFITPREAARLQSFPDWFQFYGSTSSQFEQIGNAVPPLLGRALAQSAIKCYYGLTIERDEINPLFLEKQLLLSL